MTSYADLPSEDRWALAFYVGSFAFDEAAADAGDRLWDRTPDLHARFSDLEAVTQTTPAALADEIGEPQATEITAFLRRHPQVAAHEPNTLDIAHAKLAESLALYEAGNRQRAQEVAVAAYLDGFEPVEPALAARDRALLTSIEAAMSDYRASLAGRAPVDQVRAKAEAIDSLLDRANQALTAEEASASSSFVGAFTVLLREGLEALLIVIAMIAFLEKAERRDVLPHVHGGWITALLAGGLTWAAATYLVSISGASREMSEGLGSLFAAVVLVWVGIWMHGKAQADAWQTYIREKLSAALSRESAWFLFLLAFIVVYREVFETILFFVALWSQGAHVALIAGAATATLSLALLGWALLSYSKRLPIARFFNYSSLLMAVLAVVLAGKGFAALQEAGWFTVHPLSIVPRVAVLGVYPTWEGLIAQVLTLVTLLVGFALNSRRAGTL
jgi:high-affinity iron transporter